MFRHARASLTREIDFADDGFIPVKLGVVLSDDGDAGVGKYDRKRHAPFEAYRLIPRRVISGDIPLVESLVQQRQMTVGIARDVHRETGDLHGARIERRHAVFVELDAQVLDAHLVDIGTAAERDQHLVDHGTFVPGTHADTLTLDDRFGWLAQMHGELRPQQCHGLPVDIGIAQSGDMFGGIETADLYAKPGERLGDLAAEATHANHRHARRQSFLLEQIIAGQHPCAECGPFPGNDRAGTRRDDDLPGMDAAFADREYLRLEEPCTASNAVILKIIRDFEHARNEAVAQPAHAPQHSRDIDNKLLRTVHAEAPERLAPMKGDGRLDQRFRRHAPHARAGCAVEAVIDQHKIIGLLAHLAQRRQACRACTDDGNVVCSGHVFAS